MRFTNQAVFVTGAAGGIGRALVAAFAAEGARVAAFDREPPALPEAAYRGAFELRDRAAITAALAAAEAALGPMDVLVNNAGYTRAGALDGLSGETWDEELAINLTGTQNVTAALLPGMRARRRGAIVTIGSVNGLMHFGNPAYSAAKAGLEAYMRAIAVECGPDGVRANTLCPGSVRTPAWDHRMAAEPDLAERIARYYPLGRMLEPGEIAAAALFLASPAASGITGTTLVVDGGLTAGNAPMTADITRQDKAR